jgi:hypothetical protein
MRSGLLNLACLCAVPPCSFVWPFPRWVQSFLAGVQQLALGGRDDKGVLRRVHLVPVQQLPDLSARAGQPWDANALLRFGDECLAWMARRAEVAGEGASLRFTHDPAKGVVACAAAPAVAGMAARVQAAVERGRARAGGGGAQAEADADARAAEDGVTVAAAAAAAAAAAEEPGREGDQA